MNEHPATARTPLLVLIVLFACLLAAFPADGLYSQEPASKEIYQDFRNKRTLLNFFRFRGPDVAGEIKSEVEGLRFNLSVERKKHWPAELATDFTLSGDFEMTATYEILSANRPAKGYGVGVNLTIADSGKMIQFAKISRVVRAGEGNVHLSEYWNKEKPKSYKLAWKKTEAMSGQLRLVRIGESLRYLVSDGPGQDFREIRFQEDFGASDLAHNGFSVTDSGEPGNAIDARLIDLRIRLGKIIADKADDVAVRPAPVPVVDAKVVDEAASQGLSRGWIVAMAVIGIGIVLFFAVLLAILLYLRRGRPVESVPMVTEEIRPAAIVISCTGCGKKLKAKAESIGKKVKCPQCGNAVPVAGQ